MPKYPGLGLALSRGWHSSKQYPIGAHSSFPGAQSEMIPVRELAMMSIMDNLTDKLDWHKKVFDEVIVSKWRDEALKIPDEHFWELAFRDKVQHWDQEGKLQLRNDSMINNTKQLKGIVDQATFDCCIQELRSKAAYYERTAIIPTLDATASVAKSNNLVSSELHESLRRAFDSLISDRSSAPDWHPNSSDMVQDLVHPSMYPLVYGRSRVIQDEVVGVAHAIESWAGKGNVIDEPELRSDDVDYYQAFSDQDWEDGLTKHWSCCYQWLPSNLAFQADGTVKFTSYINNLHPERYSNIYHTLERLIQTALPMWDQCLAIVHESGEQEGAGRCTPRIPRPKDGAGDDETYENWSPSDPEDAEMAEAEWDKIKGELYYGPDDPDDDEKSEMIWEHVRKPVIPDCEFRPVEYTVPAGAQLAEKFKDVGLQVIVKMASIELTPDKPEFPTGGWHIEGLMNERICGTALYYLDSENITDSDLAFRMFTDPDLWDSDGFRVGQNSFHWLESIYGVSLGSGSGSACLQNYGSVKTPEGRLLAFPNVFQHRVSSFRLKDPTKPGHRRFVALWLVDPTSRVISTANVPPQRLDWWLDSAFGSTKESREAAVAQIPADIRALLAEKGWDLDSTTDTQKLPQELMAMVREYFNADSEPLPMDDAEAKMHRKELMRERAISMKASDNVPTHSFCEH